MGSFITLSQAAGMTEFKQIGQVAFELGINPRTIRFYEEAGLIPPAGRTPRGYRLYTPAEVERIAFILRARDLDFSLDDIREILALREEGESPCLYVSTLVEERLAAIDSKIAALKQLRLELEYLHEQARLISRDNMVNKDCVCHLIESGRTLAKE